MLNPHSSGLHLPNFEINNFRGIPHISIGEFGRVTLLAGRNGVGKSSILEALRVYAMRGHQDIFREILLKREEYVRIQDEELRPNLVPDYNALFFGRSYSPHNTISIGPTSGEDTLYIDVKEGKDLTPDQLEIFSEIAPESNQRALRIKYNDSQSLLPWLSGVPDKSGVKPVTRISRAVRRISGLTSSVMPTPINFELIGPGLPSNEMIARLFDEVVLTEKEQILLEALQLTGESIEGVAVVGDDRGRYRFTDRRIVVKLKNQIGRVPLKSLGDGITRLFTTALALIESGGGFLLIDEVENGIHYSVLENFWSMVLRASRDYNVQVFATTHSFDCVKSFARAAAENQHASGVLIRLDRQGTNLRAVEYPERELVIAGKQDIEVR